MELVEGESLADRLKKGPLPLHDVLRYGRQIASALDAAHKRGIIHRDLKPANIMLTRSGAKLLDFGLAKTATGGTGAIEGLTNPATEARPLTREGTILGTFQYMAPEQLEGLEADPRTDIFAFGAVLYEMATGRRAFRGESKTSLIAAIVSSHPEPISSVMPMSPPALDHVVRKCLEKVPDDRWQSAHDVATELEWISEAGSQASVATAVTLRRRTRERLAWGNRGVRHGGMPHSRHRLFPDFARRTRHLEAVSSSPRGPQVRFHRGVQRLARSLSRWPPCGFHRTRWGGSSPPLDPTTRFFRSTARRWFGKWASSVLVTGWGVARVFCLGQTQEMVHRRRTTPRPLRCTEWPRRFMERRMASSSSLRAREVEST